MLAILLYAGMLPSVKGTSGLMRLSEKRADMKGLDSRRYVVRVMDTKEVLDFGLRAQEASAYADTFNRMHPGESAEIAEIECVLKEPHPIS